MCHVRPKSCDTPKADSSDGPEGGTRFRLRVSAAGLIVSSGGLVRLRLCWDRVGYGEPSPSSRSAKVAHQTPTHTKEQRQPQARRLLDVDLTYTCDRLNIEMSLFHA